MEKTIDDIKNEYDIVRHKNLLKYEDRKNDLYQKYPELKRLDYDIISERVKKAVSIYENNITNNENDISKLEKERAKFLKDNNIEDDYLDVKYDCEKCKDTGFIDGRKCQCFIKKEMELLSNVSNLKEAIKTDNFDNVDFSYYNQDVLAPNGKTYKEYMKMVFSHIKEQIDNIDVKPYNAIFLGATGTGKTFLSRCIASEFIKKDKIVLFISAIELLDSYFKNNPYSEYIYNSDLLILDDLGAENVQSFFRAVIHELIDKRLSLKKSTIITTNYAIKDLKQKYDESIISRIYHQYYNYLLLGEDLRGLVYGSN